VWTGGQLPRPVASSKPPVATRSASVSKQEEFNSLLKLKKERDILKHKRDTLDPSQFSDDIEYQDEMSNLFNQTEEASKKFDEARFASSFHKDPGSAVRNSKPISFKEAEKIESSGIFGYQYSENMLHGGQSSMRKLRKAREIKEEIGDTHRAIDSLLHGRLQLKDKPLNPDDMFDPSNYERAGSIKHMQDQYSGMGRFINSKRIKEAQSELAEKAAKSKELKAELKKLTTSYYQKGGLVYASRGSLVPQSSPPGKDIVDVSNIENNERVFSSYSDKFGSSSSPISDSAIVSDKVGVPQPKISSNSTRINGTVKNISAKMAQGKEVQDIKGIELSENQVAKINNLYTEAKDQTVPALDKILDKQSISKASENISSTVNNISNVIKGINQQTELVGSIGTSGTKELLAQMSPKAISGSVNDSPQYKAGGGIVYASNGTLVAARSVGTDTVPAMLTPGEFVVNRQASQQHMPILQAINSGAYNQGGVVKYLADGGIVAPQYYKSGGLAGLASGAMEAFAGMDMSAIKELASSLAGLKDTFGSLENVKSLGDSLQVAVNTMGTNISSFGEQISSMPSQVLHNVSASVTQHITGLGDAGRDILAQATTNASLIARNETSTIERNRFISEEGQGSHPDSILGHVGGGGEVTG
jgi:hypothetical protein